MAGSKEKTVEDCIKLIEDLIEIAANTTECTCETWGPFHNNHCPMKDALYNLVTSINYKLNKVFPIKHKRCRFFPPNAVAQCFKFDGHDGPHKFLS